MFFPKSKGINGGNKIVAMGRKTMYAKIDNSVYHCNPTQEMIDVYLTLATTSINVNDLNDLSLKVKKLDLSRRIGITK